MANTFSIKRFLIGFITGIGLIAIAVLGAVIMYGDRFLELLNNLYLKF